jgi:hypothetical protein
VVSNIEQRGCLFADDQCEDDAIGIGETHGGSAFAFAGKRMRRGLG